MPIMTPEEFEKLETDNDKTRFMYLLLYDVGTKVNAQPEICKAFRNEMESKINKLKCVKGLPKLSKRQTGVVGGGGTALGIILTKVADWLLQ